MRGCVAMHAPVKERDCTVQRGASHPVGQRAGRDQRPISHLTMVCSTLLLVSLALSACSGGSTNQAPTGAAKPGAVPVVVATAVQKTVPLQIRTIGTVEAIASVEVKAQVGGEITQVAFQEGQDVQAGELLFRIDTRPYEAELRRAEANLARDMAQQKQAEANLARDILQAQNAQVEARRRAHLLQQNSVSQEEYEQARTNAAALEGTVKADHAAIENAQATIRADQAAVEVAKIQLDYGTIRSPIHGRTGSLMVHQGSIVKANDATLVVINQLAPIYVTFPVPEQSLSEIKRYMAAGPLTVEAISPDEAQQPERGTLTFVDNAVDAATGTIRLKGIFRNDDKRLWPGQFVNVTLTLTTQPNAIVVPSQAVQAGQEGQYVFVVKPDLTAEFRPVVVARTIQGEALIAKGVEPGETVVTDGQVRLTPGAQVEIKSSSASAEARPS
jgi:membrane fusion protein, multidrug efflux system